MRRCSAIPEQQRDIWLANTLGTGEMMRHAIEQHGVKRIILGIGGSVSNDAGCGMAAALGVRFLDAEGAELEPVPGQLVRCASVDCSEQIALPEVLVACDVDNPLLGERGAVRVYAPQKGAAAADLEPLENMLRDVAEHYDTEVEYSMKKLSEAIGPILTVGLAAVVGFFALAIFLPMWDLTLMAK